MSYFYIDANSYINNNDLENLRLFYLPLVGRDSICLYEHLLDLFNIYNRQEKHFLAETSEHLVIDQQLLLECRYKLEAYGLIKTYENNQGIEILFLIKPLSANEIATHSYFANQLIKKCGKEKFEKLINAKGHFTLDKSNFKEVSKKYYEVFELESISNDKLDFDFVVKNLEDLKDTLTPKQFIETYTQKDISLTQAKMLHELKLMNFNTSVINLFIWYSIRVNNAVVCKFIDKIAKDFASKKIFEKTLVEIELNQAFLSKQIKIHNTEDFISDVESDELSF
ncbi:hypothetical protein FJO69_02710 [[Mycoplasma] falconis]|uniref:Replicative helicase loading/DNA remodeling protein DnaB N-terminal winged helix domain-containing protein n=1 Tax=[Mycoplasma] falconis TaxID=92403 RepID=A0A501X8Q4_9BACT|nr:DnaD domain protein [[Mycoplasma] falconis]TPE56757.1 hypothetical protein FJO69_02710 [[Mycoplasma] falconis]